MDLKKEEIFKKYFNTLSNNDKKIIEFCLQEISYNYTNNSFNITLRDSELKIVLPILQILCPSIQFHEIDSILFGNKFYWKPNDFYMPDSIEPYIWKNNNNPTFI